MLTVVMLSMIVPSTAVAARWALPGRLPNSVADVRGIALQTVIIMVVLLAIAGGVSAVLLNRGGEAVTDIERQQISRQASEFSGSALCKAAGFVWSSATSSCNAAAAVVVPPQHLQGTPHLTGTDCHSSPDGTDNHMHTWNPGDQHLCLMLSP